MKHFTLEEWADFSRGVAGAKEKSAMQNHLESGCKQCASSLSVWTRVREAGSRERSYQPPESAVRQAKGLQAIHGRPTRTSLARLLFDSFRSPVEAGVRSTGFAARQLLFGAGNYRIDLRLEPRFDSDNVTLVGQILNSAAPDRSSGQVPVMLMKSRKILATSHTNEFGEFHLECDLSGHLRLQIALPHGPVVQIPLFELSGEALSDGLANNDSEGVRSLRSQKSKGTRTKGMPLRS